MLFLKYETTSSGQLKVTDINIQYFGWLNNYNISIME